MKKTISGLLLVLGMTACGWFQGVNEEKSGADGADGGPSLGGGSGGGSGGGGGGGAGGGGAADFCSGSGGIQLPGSGQCTGDLAKKTFTFAACSCTDLSLRGAYGFKSFHSGKQQSSGKNASVGTDGHLSCESSSEVGGSLYAGGLPANGTPAVSLVGAGSVDRDVRGGGAIVASGVIGVRGDVFASGAVSGSIFTIDGKVHMTSGAPSGGVQARGGVVNEPVSIGEPCNCSNPLPITSFVKAFETSNDDAANGIKPSDLAKVTSTKILTLPCGRYYFDEISGVGADLTLTGRTAIFVAGDVDVDGILSLKLRPGAELDMFVAGNFRLHGANDFGFEEAPARVRLYVDGASVALEGALGFGANLYAPHATLRASVAAGFRGSLFAKELAIDGAFDVTYDEAILDVQGCQTPGGGCKTCRDCAAATPACKGGQCTACETDADCCAPKVCRAGKCEQIIR